MAWHFPKSSDINDVVLLDQEDVFVAQPVFLNAAIISGAGGGHDIVIAGTVATQGYRTLRVGDSPYAHEVSGGNTVKVEATGQVRAFDTSAISMYAEDQQLANHGLITQHGAEGIGYAAVYFRCLVAAPTTTSAFANTGTVEATGYGVYRHDSTEAFVLSNSGTISGGLNSFYSNSAAVDNVVNSGKMIGDVALGGGDDLYDGRLGTIDGDVLGGDGKDRLYAGAGNTKLFGQEGNDTLMGGAGADYLSGGTGTDRVSYASATKAVTVSLANPSINSGDAKGDTYNSIENLSGSNYNDTVNGNSARNAINGGAGNDLIKGYAGNDTLTGYTGADIFIFNTALNASTNVDTITDYSVAADTIQLDNAIFTALTTTGVLASAAFRANTTGLAADSSDRIIYETDTGELYYDANGNAAGGGILFAKLGIGLGITNADFVVI